MNVLVTGSTGGIGAYVVRRLLEAGHSLRAMDQAAQPRPPDYEYISADVRSLNQVRQAMQGMDAVVHLAAIPFDQPGQDEAILDTNIRGTWNVLMAAHEAGVSRVVNFSSINALGQAEPAHPGLYLPLDDDTPHYCTRNYYISKHVGEELCAAFAARGVLTAASLRPTQVTHPGKSRRPWFFDLMPEEFKTRRAIEDFFSYVDVRDVAEAALLSLTAPLESRHQAFLLTSDESRVRVPSAEIVEKYYPQLTWPKVSKEAYLAKGEFISLVACSAAKRVLGWQPKWSQFDPTAGY